MSAKTTVRAGAPADLKPPSDDKRWRIVTATMRRHGNAQSALIETLHTVQSTFGYLDEASLAFVAHSLRVPLSKVYGVATFYSLFRLKPQGKHTCVVCMGTACYIKGSDKLVAAAERFRNADPATGNRQNGEQDERGQHRPRALMGVVFAAALVKEGQVPKAEHVERSQQGG